LCCDASPVLEAAEHDLDPVAPFVPPLVIFHGFLAGLSTGDGFVAQMAKGDSSCESSVVAGVHEQTHPAELQDQELQAYNQALKQRGSLTIWFDPDMAWVPPPTGKRGRQPQYSDAAIQTCLTMKLLFGMALRQTTG